MQNCRLLVKLRQLPSANFLGQSSNQSEESKQEENSISKEKEIPIQSSSPPRTRSSSNKVADKKPDKKSGVKVFLCSEEIEVKEIPKKCN